MADEQGEGGKAPIPYDRFQQVVAEKNALNERVGALEKEARTYQERAATADTLAKQLEEARTKHAADASAWDRQRALMGAGITDPDDVELADYYYSKAPDKDRPAMGDWIKGFRDDPNKAPKALRPLFATASDTEADEPDAEVEALPNRETRPPRTQRTADPSGTQGARHTPTAEQVRAAREKAQKTGDWADFNRLAGFKPPGQKQDAK
jgi:hypothetical protein